MTEEEKQKFLAVYERQQAGYRYMQLERDLRLRQLDTIAEIQILADAFNHATDQPMRQTTGLINFYRILCPRT